MPGIRITSAVRWLIIINVAAFLIQLVGDTFLGAHIRQTFALVPYQVFEHHAYWQLITSVFMHADLFHILFNMLILWMIGSELEAHWGMKFFLKYYFICAISAGFFYLLVQSFFRGTQAELIPLMGSSGGVYGLLVAYGVIFSERMLLFMMVFPMKAKHFVVLLAAIEFISTVFYSGAGITNAAHLGGMAVGFGYLFLKAWLRVQNKQKKGNRMAWGKGRSRASHLKLVVNNEIIRQFDGDKENGSEKPTFH